MIFSFLKLKKLASLPATVTIEDVTNAINSIGFEVEEYTQFSDVEGIKFGHVLKTYKNPNADRLTVCEIEFSDQNRVIQTNATNVKQGDYLMAFVPGSRSKKMVFSPREMKGIVSEGMLVSLEELGYNTEYFPDKWYDGIFTFQTPVDLNSDPIEYFELNDYLIDVTILSNRADANSYLVMARELAAYFNTNVTWPKDSLNRYKANIKVNGLEETEFFTLVETQTKDINISLQDEVFLIKNNVKTISKPVDLSNLVLLYTGLPTHAYDAAKIEGEAFSVKKYTGDVVALGNNKISLEESLCVFDAKKPVSVAANIGLDNSSCSQTTTDVIFEVASFNLKEVRHSKKQVKLETASANRASKKINNGLIQLAHQFMSGYLTSASEIINNQPVVSIAFDFDEQLLNRYAGFDITNTQKYTEVIKKLEVLGLYIKNNKVYVPDYRFDIETMQDFSEEVFRFYGYENFKMIQPAIIQAQNIVYKDYISLLAKMHYQNVRTFTLTNAEKNIFNPFEFAKPIRLETFASAERTEIRYSMVPSLYEVLDYNAKRNIKNLSIFEIGMIQDVTNVLAMASNVKDFDEMKLDIIELLDCEVTFKRATQKPFHPNLSAWIYKGDKKIGYLAKIHPEIINSEAYYAEILLDNDFSEPQIFTNYKHDPLKQRDFTLNIKAHEDVQNILDKLKNLRGIYQVQVVDRYIKEDKSINITISVLIEDWAVKKLEQLLVEE